MRCMMAFSATAKAAVHDKGQESEDPCPESSDMATGLRGSRWPVRGRLVEDCRDLIDLNTFFDFAKARVDEGNSDPAE